MLRHDRRYDERRDELPRASNTPQAIFFHPNPNKDKPYHILFVDKLADTNPASRLSLTKPGQRGAVVVPGGGGEALLLVKNALGEIKGERMRYCEIEQRGYRIFKVDGEFLPGDSLDERDGWFQKMMLKRPFGHQFTLEAVVANSKETVTLTAKLIGEETLAETLLREVRGETGLTVNIRPSVRKQHSADLSDAWVRRAPKRKGGRIVNWVYTFICDASSMDIANIEETNEIETKGGKGGRIWFNPLDSLPMQLRALLEKRPWCNKLPFFSQILSIIEALMNEGYSCDISKAVQDKMADDHPLKSVRYGTMAYLVIDPERKRNPNFSEHSLIHPSWLMVLEYKNRLPKYTGAKNEEENEWERILRWMRDNKKSSLSAEEKQVLLEAFDRELKKDEIPTMAPETAETADTAPEVVTDMNETGSTPRFFASHVNMQVGGAMTQETIAVEPTPDEFVSEEEKARWRDEGANEEDIRLMIEHRIARQKATV